MPSLSRRNLLDLSALGLSAAFAGCTQSAVTTDTTATGTDTPSQTNTSTTPVEDGRAGPVSSCSGEYSSFDPSWVVEGPGPLAGFDLTLDHRTFTFEDTLTASLRNVTDESQSTGNRGKYDVQYRASDGWRTIFGKKDHVYWTDEAINHEPGQGFTWQFPLTNDGLADIADDPGYEVCAPLDPGRYRFVYWGITTEREENEDYETDYALGVPFTVTDD